MKERPINLSAEEVRAILEGRKTQIRRVIVPQPPSDAIDVFFWWHDQYPKDQCADDGIYYLSPDGLVFHQKLRYGVPGERLWVRETHGFVYPEEFDVPLRDCKIEYRADLAPGNIDYPGQWPADEARGNPDAPKWRPSIHMPRWASRIALEITGVRPERLQEISEEDVIAEGYRRTAFGLEEWFSGLWDTLNAKRGFGWGVNPWVFVIEFKMLPTMATNRNG